MLTVITVLTDRERFRDVAPNSEPVKPTNVEMITKLYDISSTLEQFAGWLNSRELLNESVKVRQLARHHNLQALQLLETERR